MATHWWRTDRLVDQLATGSMSESEAFRYMVVSAIQFNLALYVTAWFGNWRGWQLVVECLVVLVIAVVGVHECYKANGGPQGRQFLLRYCALSVPVAVKLSLLSLGVGVAYTYGGAYVITRSTFRDPAFVYEVLAFVLATVFAFAFYWRVAFHLARVVKRERPNPSLHPTGSSGLRPPPPAGELQR